MPKVSFYLRNEDVEKWKAIEKKTEWIHHKLYDTKPFRAQNLTEQTATVRAIIDEPDGGYVPPTHQTTHKSGGLTYKDTDNWGA